MKKWLGKHIGKLAAGIVVAGAAAGSILNASEIGNLFQPQNFKRFENEKQSAEYDYVAGDGEDADLADEQQNGTDAPSGEDQQVLQVETETETQLPGNHENVLGVADNKPDTKESENKNAIEFNGQKKETDQQENTDRNSQTPSSGGQPSGQKKEPETENGRPDTPSTEPGNGSGSEKETSKRETPETEPGTPGTDGTKDDPVQPSPAQSETTNTETTERKPEQHPQPEQPSDSGDSQETEKPEDKNDNLDEADRNQLKPDDPVKTEKGQMIGLVAEITKEYYVNGDRFQNEDAEVYAIYQKEDGSQVKEKLTYGGENGYKIIFSTSDPGWFNAVFNYRGMSTKSRYHVLSSYVNVKYGAVSENAYYTSDFPGLPVKELDENAFQILETLVKPPYNRVVSGNIIDLSEIHSRMIACLGKKELQERFQNQSGGNYASVEFLVEENGYLKNMLRGFMEIKNSKLEDSRSWLYYPAEVDQTSPKNVADIVVPVPDGYKIRRVVNQEADLAYCRADQVLAGCPDQEEVTVPMGVTAIRFETKADKIRTLILPESVQSIDIESIAKNLPNLENYVYASGDENGLNRSGYKIEDGILYSADGKTLLSVPAGRKQVTVPEKVTTLAENCFAGMPDDAVITFEKKTPPGRKGNTGFQGKVQVSSSEYDLVRKAYEFAFAEEANKICFITEEDQNDPYQYIETENILSDRANAACLLAVPQNIGGEYQIPESVKEIGELAFAGCGHLTDIEIGQQVEVLHDGSLILAGNVQTITLQSGEIRIGGQLFGDPEEGATVPDIRVYVSQNYEQCLQNWREMLDPVYGDGTADALLSDEKPVYLYEDGVKYQKFENEEGTTYRLIRIVKRDATSVQIKEGTTQIAPEALKNSDRLEILLLPESLKSLENVDFSNNHALKNIYAGASDVKDWNADTLPQNTQICQAGKEYTAFGFEDGMVYGKNADNTWNLLKVPTDRSEEIRLWPGTSAVEVEAAKGCTKLPGIQIADQTTLKSIGEYAFSDCMQMNMLDLTECSHLTQIGRYAFENCSKITEVKLPESVRVLEEGVFENASGLTTFTGTGVVEIGSRAFYDCESLTGTKTADKVISMGTKAFSGCRNLKKIILPDSLKSLGESCFENCVAVESLEIDGSITNIGRYCFVNCQELKNVTFGETVKKTLKVIGVQAFAGCSALETVDLTDLTGLSQMGAQTFLDDTNLTTVRFPESLRAIPERCFWNCENLSIVQLKSTQVTDVDEKAFGENIPAFLHVWVEKEALENYKKAYAESLDPMYGDGTMEKVLGVTDDSMEVVKGVLFEITDQGRVLKRASEELTGSYTVPEDTVEIAADAFAGCDKITELIIPEGSAVSLGDRCMKGCKGLLSVLIRGDVPKWGEETFMDCTSLLQAYVGRDQLTNIDRIGTRAFKGCTGLSARGALSFSGKVRVWGEEAFAGCTSLQAFGVTNEAITSLETVEDSVFQGCSSMTAAFTSKYTALKKIGAHAFANCSSLRQPSVPANVTTIGEGCFENCASLTYVSFYGNIEEYPKDCFRNCPKLIRTGGMPAAFSGLKRIGENAYQGCKSLTASTSWNLAKYINLESIADGAFAGCENLASSELSVTVKKIGDHAFDGCIGMATLTLHAVTPPEIGTITFSSLKDGFGIRVPDSKDDQDSIYLAYLEYLTKQIGKEKALEILDSISDGAKERYLKEMESESDSESESESESESQSDSGESSDAASGQNLMSEDEPVIPEETQSETPDTQEYHEEIRTEPETEAPESETKEAQTEIYTETNTEKETMVSGEPQTQTEEVTQAETMKQTENMTQEEMHALPESEKEEEKES